MEHGHMPSICCESASVYDDGFDDDDLSPNIVVHIIKACVYTVQRTHTTVRHPPNGRYFVNTGHPKNAHILSVES